MKKKFKNVFIKGGVNSPLIWAAAITIFLMGALWAIIGIMGFFK